MHKLLTISIALFVAVALEDSICNGAYNEDGFVVFTR